MMTCELYNLVLISQLEWIISYLFDFNWINNNNNNLLTKYKPIFVFFRNNFENWFKLYITQLGSGGWRVFSIILFVYLFFIIADNYGSLSTI